MVAVAYEVDRAILLLIYLFSTFLSLLQIYVSHHLQKKQDTKKNLVHYCILFASFSFFMGVIDLGGVFHIIDRYAVLVLMGIGWNMLVLGSLFVIHSHFEAHYLSLRKPMSMGSFWFLGIFLLIGFLIFNLGQCLSEKYKQISYLTYANIYVFLEVTLLLIYDGIGYVKIRKLLVQAVRLEYPEYQEPTWCCSYTPISEDPKRKRTVLYGVDYEMLLKRMWKFHAFIHFSGVFCLILGLWKILQQFQRMNDPPIYPDPNTFSLEETSHVFIPGLFLYTWWAWVPLSERASTIPASVGLTKNTSKKRKSNNESRMASTHMSQDSAGIETRVIGPEQEAFLPERDREVSSPAPSSPSKDTGLFGFETAGDGISPQIDESSRNVEQFAGGVGIKVESIGVGDDHEMGVL